MIGWRRITRRIDIGSHRFVNGKGSDSEDGSGGVPCPLHTRPALSHTSHSDWRDQSAGPEASASLSLSWEQATVHFWRATCTVSDDNSLRCAHTVEMMSRWHSIFYFAARHTRRHDHLPTTSIQLTLCRGCGPSWSQSGPWHAPLPRPGMSEREEEEEKEGRKKEDEVTGRPREALEQYANMITDQMA